MSLSNLVRPVNHFLKENSPTILTALGVSGALGTAYLTAKASFKAARAIDEDRRVNGIAEDRTDRVKDAVKLVWTMYIPAATSGAITVVCIIGGAKIGAKRTAAAYSLLTVSEKALFEYSEKVREQLGDKKEQGIRDAVAQDRVAQNPPSGLIVVESGNVLCHEAHTGRYFNSNIEALRKAQNTINAQLIHQVEATLSDFYHLIRLPQTTYSSEHGWDSDKMLELRFSAVMAENDQPCISFDYNYVRPLYGMRD